MKTHVRRVLFAAACAVAALSHSRARGTPEAGVVKIQIDPRAIVASIPDDFIGFGYETSAVAQQGLFSPDNASLLQLYRNLAPHGLVRIGGNVSDHTQYRPRGTPAVEPETGTSVINASSLENLAGFLRASGWKVMWGLNLGTGSRVQAVEEAVAVSHAMKDRLQSFEIGNEVDLLRRFNGSYDRYYQAYLGDKAAIRSALPAAAFSGPDVARQTRWCANFARTESSDLKLLTHHYYRTGAGKPDATLGILLREDPGLESTARTLQGLCAGKGIAYRINETNSFYGGGKAGVSDTFGSALWCLDFMYFLASHQCAGVNIETDINQHAWISHYTPIFREASGRCVARPIYYGMLAFAMAGRGDLLQLTIGPSDLNLTAYATRDPRGNLWLTLINKDLSRGARVMVALPAAVGSAELFRLAAPSVESRDRVELGGAKVADDGTWSPEPPERVTVSGGVAALELPAASAAVVRWRADRGPKMSPEDPG